MSKPHLVLEWTMDHTTDPALLYTELADDCKYYALQGGHTGYTKIYQGVETTITPGAWELTEKFWISEQYGEEVGYFQPDLDREGIEPKNGKMEGRKMGFGRNGEYLDHMARSQLQLDSHDMASFHFQGVIDWPLEENKMPAFETPDKGLTVYKKLPTNKSFYNDRFNADHPEDGTWTMVPQPCAMQPFSKGRILSDYDEMRLYGCPEEIIKLAEAGEWHAPEKPELQRLYVLPTVNTIPLTDDNMWSIW